MKLAVIVIISILAILAACQKEQIACTADVQECSDGSFVSRTPPDCEFPQCPPPDRTTITNITPTDNVTGNISIEIGTKCPAERPEICTEVYQPACGWYNASIQCVRYPCANTYSNSCYACRDAKVASWTEGKCPTEFNSTR